VRMGNSSLYKHKESIIIDCDVEKIDILLHKTQYVKLHRNKTNICVPSV